VHLVVEAGFAVQGGVWTCVDAGVELGRANAQANKRGGAGKYAGTGLDQPPVLVSEALANASWSDPELSDAGRLESITRACVACGAEVPAAVTLMRIGEVRECLARLRERWRTLIPKGALRLAFDPAAPERSFTGFAAAAQER
jgi:hypothetical protein